MFGLYPAVSKHDVFPLLSADGNDLLSQKGLKLIFALFSDLQIEHILFFVVCEIHDLDLWIFKGYDITFFKYLSVWLPYLHESAEFWANIFDEKLIFVLYYFSMMPRDGLVNDNDIIVRLPANFSRVLEEDDLLFKGKLQ